MQGERDLKRLLASLEPVQRAGRFVFAVIDDEALLEAGAPDATGREDEGLAVVLRREQADRLGIAYDYVAAWITLRVHSALDAAGLTAAISTALADAGLSCNVIAGYHDDHLLVPADRAPEALAVLSDVSAWHKTLIGRADCGWDTRSPLGRAHQSDPCTRLAAAVTERVVPLAIPAAASTSTSSNPGALSLALPADDHQRPPMTSPGAVAPPAQPRWRVPFARGRGTPPRFIRCPRRAERAHLARERS